MYYEKLYKSWYLNKVKNITQNPVIMLLTKGLAYEFDLYFQRLSTLYCVSHYCSELS